MARAHERRTSQRSSLCCSRWWSCTMDWRWCSKRRTLHTCCSLACRNSLPENLNSLVPLEGGYGCSGWIAFWCVRFLRCGRATSTTIEQVGVVGDVGTLQVGRRRVLCAATTNTSSTKVQNRWYVVCKAGKHLSLCILYRQVRWGCSPTGVKLLYLFTTIAIAVVDSGGRARFSISVFPIIIVQGVFSWGLLRRVFECKCIDLGSIPEWRFVHFVRNNVGSRGRSYPRFR